MTSSRLGANKCSLKIVEFRHGYVASRAHRFALLMAAAAAVIGIGAIAAAGARTGHAGAARSANGKAGQERRAIDDPRRGYFRVVLRQPLFDALKKLDRNDGRHGNFDDVSGVMKDAGFRIPQAVGPFACRVAAIGQDFVQLADAE